MCICKFLNNIAKRESETGKSALNPRNLRDIVVATMSLGYRARKQYGDRTYASTLGRLRTRRRAQWTNIVAHLDDVL